MITVNNCCFTGWTRSWENKVRKQKMFMPPKLV